MLQLRASEVGLAERPFVKDADRRDVRETSRGEGVFGGERVGGVAEEVQRTDDLLAESEGIACIH